MGLGYSGEGGGEDGSGCQEGARTCAPSINIPHQHMALSPSKWQKRQKRVWSFSSPPCSGCLVQGKRRTRVGRRG